MLHARAPLWLRLQTADPQRVLGEFATQNWPVRQSEALPGAIQVLAETDITKTTAWQNGFFEVQDLGSQLILESIGITPGGRWLDACAGAGGKTLQLARLLGSSGRVDAHDVRASALRELSVRLARFDAGYRHLIDDKSKKSIRAEISIRDLLDENALGKETVGYDGVLVDAPCSGSGTWRRAPHLKWTTTPAQIAQAAEKQLALLTQFAARVRPGGTLVYATCSLSRMENEEVAAAFLAANPSFETAPFARPFGATPRSIGLAILPATHNTDGFYVASLRRKT
jgi:16S rRNA (cytosine967-C5)-methyltransferase